MPEGNGAKECAPMTTITVYTTGPGCMQCRLTTAALTTAGLAFEEIDVRHAPEALDYVRDELGYTQAPVVVVASDDHWSGFQPDQINRVASSVKETLVSGPAIRAMP
jgi:glutaredoxin-like protein NrdH